jgi:hypothetical protein
MKVNRETVKAHIQQTRLQLAQSIKLTEEE